MRKSKRSFLTAFGLCALTLAPAAAAWACTAHGTGMSEEFAVVPKGAPAPNAWAIAAGRMSNATDTQFQTLPGLGASTSAVNIYWHVLGPDDDSSVVNVPPGLTHGGTQRMPCHLDSVVTSYSGTRTPQAGTGLFSFEFQLPNYAAVANPEGEGTSPQAVEFCALEGSGGDNAWTSQPVVLIY